MDHPFATQQVSLSRISGNMWQSRTIEAPAWRRLYVNGSMAAQQNLGYSLLIPLGCVLRIKGSGRNRWAHVIREPWKRVSLYRRALSVEEIQMVYNAGSLGQMLVYILFSPGYPLRAARPTSPARR
jgi:hypothetical protein